MNESDRRMQTLITHKQTQADAEQTRDNQAENKIPTEMIVGGKWSHPLNFPSLRQRMRMASALGRNTFSCSKVVEKGTLVISRQKSVESGITRDSLGTVYRGRTNAGKT